MHRKTEGCFSNRYRLTGALTTRTPLHVGDGDRLRVRARDTAIPLPPLRPDAENPDPLYNAFVTGADAAGADPVIVIPGSTLKGVLRAWLRRRGAPPDLVAAVFGFEDNGNGNKGHGGKAEFHDAPLQAEASGNHAYRWWDTQRRTCLAPGVALDPRTRTARDKLLYYTEYAPQGSTFAVTVTAQNLEPAERNLLRAAFAQGFGDPHDPVRVGAGTADDWGRMSWNQTACAIIEPPDVKTWLDNGAAQPYTAIFRQDTTPLTPLALTRPDPSPSLRLDVRLLFRGAVLVNDPSQERRRAAAAGEEGIALATVRRKDGAHILPSSSVRGALRAQARRIWQTRAHTTNGYLQSATPPEAKRGGDEKGLPAFYRMLGAPGWRSPISVPDFELVGDPQAHAHTQEFVAVDRFTGGAARGKKFSAECLYAPEFRATISVDLGRWQGRDQAVNPTLDPIVGGWALLLLLFLLRDLREGDIQVGSGASKGYGACDARIEVACSGAIPRAYGGARLAELFRGALNRDPAALADTLLVEWAGQLDAVLADRQPL